MYGPGGATFGDGGEVATSPAPLGAIASSTCRWFMSLAWVVAPGDMSTARLTWPDAPIVNGAL